MRTTVHISAIPDHAAVATLHEGDVDDGCLYSWIPAQLLGEVGIKPVRTQRFESSEGRIFVREVGFAIVSAVGGSTPTPVVFSLEGDRTVLGAMALSGLNLRIDSPLQKLVPGGPYPAPANIAA